MIHLLAMLLRFSVLAIYAAIAAIAVCLIINIDGSWTLRFIISGIAIFAVILVNLLTAIRNHLVEIQFYTRLTFVALQIRNAGDGLEPAIDRLKDDREVEKAERALLQGPDLNWLILPTFVVTTALILNAGWIGPVGQGWISQILRGTS